MRIHTDCESYRPKWARWYAYDADNYEGPVADYAGDPVGVGETEAEAIADLHEQLEMREADRAWRKEQAERWRGQAR